MSRRPVDYSAPNHPLQGRASGAGAYRSRRSKWPERVLLAIIIVLAIAFVYSLWPHGSSPASNAPTHAPQLSNLAMSGLRQHGSFTVNKPIRLIWKATHGADQYHVQVVLAPVGRNHGGGTPFQHPLLSVNVGHPWYVVNLGSPGTYFWRVRGAAGKHWSRYTVPRKFLVALPIIPRPVALLPHSGAHVGQFTRLCWTKVRVATAYQVWVTGQRPAVATGQCERISTGPGIHTWRVAAVLQGKHTYVGPYSAMQWFSSGVSVAQPPQRTTAANPPAVAAPPVPTAVPLPVATRPAVAQVPPPALTPSTTSPRGATVVGRPQQSAPVVVPVQGNVPSRTTTSGRTSGPSSIPKSGNTGTSRGVSPASPSTVPRAKPTPVRVQPTQPLPSPTVIVPASGSSGGARPGPSKQPTGCIPMYTC